MPRRKSLADDLYRVFVSHGSHDVWVAAPIARGVREAGATAFLDETDVPKGTNFKKRIREEIGRSDELIALFTPWSASARGSGLRSGPRGERAFPSSRFFTAWNREYLEVSGQGKAILEDVNLLELNTINAYLDQLKVRTRPEGLPMRPKVFISYARQDYPFPHQLVEQAQALQDQRLDGPRGPRGGVGDCLHPSLRDQGGKRDGGPRLSGFPPQPLGQLWAGRRRGAQHSHHSHPDRRGGHRERPAGTARRDAVPRCATGPCPLSPRTWSKPSAPMSPNPSRLGWAFLTRN